MTTAASTVRGSATRPFTTIGRRNGQTKCGGATGTSTLSWSIFMRSFLNTLLGWLGLTPPRLRCRRRIWDAGVEELARRTLGERRESGAYLLGQPRSDRS